MKKIQIFTIIVLIFAFGFFGYYIYSYNQNFEQDFNNHQSDIQLAKNKQNVIDNEFQETQVQKKRTLSQQETNQRTKDEDSDGLTYEQEIRLGTSDNDKDTDGDGVDDNEDKHPNGGGKNYKINTHWTHNGLKYSTEFGIAEDKYQYYKDQPRGYYSKKWRKFVTPNDPTIQTIVQDVVDVSKTSKDTNKARIAINFVTSMIYEKDIEYNGNGEWPKYPIETIIEEKGDCEDTSFLMASVLEALGYDTVLLKFTGHLAVGLSCSNCKGTYYNHNGKKYYFLESTSSPGEWEIGRSWGDFKTEIPEILDIY